MTRFRICMVTTFYPPYNFGGDGIFVRRLSNALAATGHLVDVVHYPAAYELLGGRLAEDAGYADLPGVRHHALSRPPSGVMDMVLAHQLGRPIGLRTELDRLVRSIEPDVIHFHNISLLGGPGVLTVGSGVKLCTMHDYWFVCAMHTLWRNDREACTRRTCVRCSLRGRRPPQLWRYGSMLARATSLADVFLAPSRFAADTHRHNGFPGDITVWPHFAHADRLRPPGEEKSRAPYFLFAGRLERLKGVVDLAESWRGVQGAELWIAGEGKERESLERLTADLPLVRVLGWVDDERLRSLMRGAIAVVVPSLCYETQGLVGIEAFAVGTPVVVRAIGALRELVADGGGLEYWSAAELRAATERLLHEPGLVRRLSREARNLHRQHYSQDVYLDRYLTLARRLRDRGHTARKS